MARGVGPGPVRVAPRGLGAVFWWRLWVPGPGAAAAPFLEAAASTGRGVRGCPWLEAAGAAASRASPAGALPLAARSEPTRRRSPRPAPAVTHQHRPLPTAAPPPRARGRAAFRPPGWVWEGRTGRTAAGAGRSPGLTRVWGNGLGLGGLRAPIAGVSPARRTGDSQHGESGCCRRGASFVLL